MFKIALTAGHYKYTSGKRCDKAFDPKETREWTLNDRIADKVEKLLAANYTGYQLIRTDDTTGEKKIDIAPRVNAAKNFKADFYLSIHHNAGIHGGKGGGIVAYVRAKPSAEDLAWQKALYNELIAATGLKGNRSNPLPKSNLYECYAPTMPAVLLELGFMDSATDVPIILTDSYATKCAEAIVKVLAERGKLEKKSTAATELAPDKYYRVQIGAYKNRKYADETLAKAKAAGFTDAYIKVS
jgi:N-acetylmuramoyl-L-alanine amidase